MAREEILAAAQAFIRQLRALETGAPDAAEGLAQLFSEDAELSNPLLQHQGGGLRGRAAIVTFWRNYRASFADIRSDFGEVTLGDNAAGLFWRSKGTDAQGRPVDYEGVSLLCFDGDGMIQRFRGYFDSASLHQTAASDASSRNKAGAG